MNSMVDRPLADEEKRARKERFAIAFVHARQRHYNLCEQAFFEGLLFFGCSFLLTLGAVLVAPSSKDEDSRLALFTASAGCGMAWWSFAKVSKTYLSGVGSVRRHFCGVIIFMWGMLYACWFFIRLVMRCSS